MSDQVQAVRHFNRFYTNFMGLLNENLLDSPVTLTEGRILFEINSLSPCRAKELVKRLSLDRGYMSRVLKRLERIGLIERTVDQYDRRIRNLMLTQDGKLLLRRIDRSATAHIGEVLKALDKAEREDLVRSMNAIETMLSKLEVA